MRRSLSHVAIPILFLLVAPPALPVGAASAFASGGFPFEWQQGEAIAPNFWGPLINAKEGMEEPYGNGQRLVQYFDKGRMEYTGGRVTNGLLATELVKGRIQTGDTSFENRPPPPIPIAGDPDNPGPTYATLGGKAATLLNPATSAVGSSVTATASATGETSNATSPGTPDMTIAVFDTATQHNVPAAFATYRDRAGLLTIGYAISEPFRTTVKVGGAQKDVMVQVFERRLLTYTASNDPAFRVEMGNIGQHYFRWRYPNGPPNAASSPTVLPLPGRLAFGSPDEQVFLSNPDGTGRVRIAAGYSPTMSPDGTRVAFVTGLTPNPGEDKRTIAIRSAAVTGADVRDECVIAANVPSFGGADMRLIRWSPSGRYLILNSTQNGPGSIQLCDTATHTLLDRAKYAQGDLSLAFDWTPDGTNVIWQASIVYGDGKDLYYGDPDRKGDAAVQLTSGQNRTGQGNDRLKNNWYYAFARISPDGKTVAVAGSKIFFLSVPGQKSPLDGKSIEGLGDVRQLAWSPDGTALAVSAVAPSFYQSVSIVDIASGKATLVAANAELCDWSRQ